MKNIAKFPNSNPFTDFCYAPFAADFDCFKLEF